MAESAAAGKRILAGVLGGPVVEIAYRSDTPTEEDSLIAVICSNRDQFLSNTFIKREYGGISTEFADADHGNTVDMADAYVVAWKRLLKQIGARLQEW